MMVSSETLPSRLPARPALCTGGGGFWDASDASLLRTFSSAVVPTSGASANSSRNCLIFSSTALSCPGAVAVGVSVVMSAISFRFFTVQAKRSASPVAGQARLSTSSIAWTKSSGASCGRLWPMPPVSVRCAYLPVNRMA